MVEWGVLEEPTPLEHSRLKRVVMDGCAFWGYDSYADQLRRPKTEEHVPEVKRSDTGAKVPSNTVRGIKALVWMRVVNDS